MTASHMTASHITACHKMAHMTVCHIVVCHKMAHKKACHMTACRITASHTSAACRLAFQRRAHQMPLALAYPDTGWGIGVRCIHFAGRVLEFEK